MIEIKKGDYNRYRDAQEWTAIDGAVEYNILTMADANEQEVKDFIEGDGITPLGLSSKIIRYTRRRYLDSAASD